MTKWNFAGMVQQKGFSGTRPTNSLPSVSAVQEIINGTAAVVPRSLLSSENDTSDFFSEISAQYSDDDTTPIPSLHGNLVRNRYRRDPLEFYELVEPLGEGSMGSVSKVRKRTEVIGGSARPEFLRTRKQSSVSSGFLQFCPILQRQSSNVSFSVSSPGASRGDKRQISLGNWPQGCFALFCCPAQPRQKSVLDPIQEDATMGVSTESDGECSAGDGCWRGMFRGKKNEGKAVAVTVSNNTNADADNLRREDSNQKTEQFVERTLKHSTSSLITYGHKDVVYALKSIHLDRVSNYDFMTELKNEVAMLKELDHPNIVKCFETFNYNGSLFLVLELLCSGSDLYSRDPYTEEEARTIIRAVLSAVAYCHSKAIIHRDLKYENIMFTSQDKGAECKIIDYGLSTKYAANTFLHDAVGTVYTMAPELLKGGYTQAIDVWSVGVISFMLLSSSMPFYGKDRKQVVRKIVKGQYQFISRRWNTVSASAKAFVAHVLQHEPEKRPSAAEALVDAWFTRGKLDSQGFAPEVALMDKVQATIQSFAGYGLLKKIALMIISYHSSSEEIGFLRKMFERFDLKRDGEVTLEEFKTVLADYEYTDIEMEGMFRAMDLDGTGVVHYSEFLAATIETHGSISEEQVAESFDRLDNDDSGFITKEDIKDFLGKDVPESYIDSIMFEADLDNDNKISYREFLGLWDQKGDAKMRKDQEDVKKRRHRRADSIMSEVSLSSDFSDDDFDEFGVEPSFPFQDNEFAKLLEDPDTPVSRKRVSAVSAFELEKDRSIRRSSARGQSLRGSCGQGTSLSKDKLGPAAGLPNGVCT